MLSPVPSIPILRYSTEDLPPEARYDAWVKRDWPRTEPVYHTTPTEPFNILMESAPLGQILFVRTEITAMIWERRVRDIRDSDFHPVIVNMMVHGSAHGDMDGSPFFESPGTYHFHDLACPSRHESTSSLTYALVVPRDLAKVWLEPIDRLHGLVVAGETAAAVMDLAQTVWRLLPELTPEGAARFERAFLELLAVGAEMASPTGAQRVEAQDALRSAAIAAIEQKFGLEQASPATLCNALNVSSSRLAAAFRGDGGVKAYILTRRLDQASAALTGLKQPEPIGNIAHRLGFSDAAHLSRAFRQRFGLSPRAYRKLHRDGAGKA